MKLASLARCSAPAQTQGSGHHFNHIADHLYHLMCERSVGTSVVSLCTTINVPLAWADELLARLQSKGCKSGTWLKLQEGSWCYSVKLERHFKSYLSCWMTELKELILNLHGDIWYLIFLTTVYILFFFHIWSCIPFFFASFSFCGAPCIMLQSDSSSMRLTM